MTIFFRMQITNQGTELRTMATMQLRLTCFGDDAHSYSCWLFYSQVLDPRTTATMFANTRCLGEKKIGEEDCFILKLAADPSTLHDWSDGPAEIIRHVLFDISVKKLASLYIWKIPISHRFKPLE